MIKMKNYLLVIAFAISSFWLQAQIPNPATPTSSPTNPPSNPYPVVPPTIPTPVDSGAQRRSDSIKYRSMFPRDSLRFNNNQNQNKMNMPERSDTNMKSPKRIDSP